MTSHRRLNPPVASFSYNKFYKLIIPLEYTFSTISLGCYICIPGRLDRDYEQNMASEQNFDSTYQLVEQDGISEDHDLEEAAVKIH